MLLALAGRDPTEGAGVDADRRAAARQGVELHAVVTADTDQDGERVRSIGARSPEEWELEARQRTAARRPAALKTGLLPGAEHVRAAARIAAELAVPAVVDPVLQASGGEPFLDAAGVEALLAELVPLGVILTPNLPEAACLCGLPLEALAVHPEARVDAARRLLERGARAVVLKGGHGREDPVRDLVLEAGAEPWWQVHARIPGASIHGSGCHHAATLAAVLARGGDLREGAREAAGYLAELLVRAVPLGPP